MSILLKLIAVVMAAVATMALMLAMATGNQPIAKPTPTAFTLPPVPAFDHIYVIVMENKEEGSIVGNPDAPYLNQLIHQYGLATNYTAVTHPSQPNYIALWSGSTQGVLDDGVHRVEAQHLGDQIENAGKTWKVFAQNLPIVDSGGNPICFTGAAASNGPDGPGTYARKHEPAITFVNVSNNTSRCEAHITDFSHFDPAAANLELIIPNMCNDMHDCGVKAGDSWLQGWLPSHILSTSTWSNSNSALFITWDEGSGSTGGGGKVATIVISKQTPAGFTSDVAHNHYSLLRTIEQAWGLGCLKESCSANTLGEFFK